MQSLNIRYALFLFPLIYILLPFVLSGTFVILGGVALITFLTGVILFIIISNIQFGGSAEGFTIGGSANLGLNSEGGYSLFVVCIGGIFYLGATLAVLITPLLNILVGLINAILTVISWLGISTIGLQTSLINTLGGTSATNLAQVYPLNISIVGISVFGALDVIMASMFILSLYFMVSSRGQ